MPSFKPRKFSLRTQSFGTGSKRRVSLVGSRKIMVNGVKQKPGQRASKSGNQLLAKASHRSK